MPWLALLNGLLSLASSLASFLRDKQLLDAGRAMAISGSIKKGAMDETAKAIRARDAVRDDADSVRDDPDNRDGR